MGILLAWLGRLFFFKALAALIKNFVLYFHGKAVGKDEERLQDSQDALHDTEEAARIRDRVAHDPKYRDELHDRFSRD